MINTELSKKLKGKRFKMGHCYRNAFKVFQESTDTIDYFVIGYCTEEKSKAIRHAWNLDKDGNIVDVTFKKADLEKMKYFEAFKYNRAEFFLENIMRRTTNAALKGLNVDKELDCIEKNNLKLYEFEYVEYIKSFIEIRQ